MTNFIRGFYVTDMGIIQHKWINPDHIKDMEPPTAIVVYDSKGNSETRFPSVCKIRSDNEFVGYVDVSKPIEKKSLEDFVTPIVEPKNEVRRGRPPKNVHVGQHGYR